jgi:demethoxyubiquinone hydroxylase (CLK1/Coq7/Cat5 family)
MREDESHHAAAAETRGAKKLPEGIKRLMMLASKFMTKTAYHI